MTQHYNIKAQEVTKILQSIQYQPDIIKRINHPAEQKTWDWYQQFFITPSRVQSGLKYWHKHRHILNVAREKYGVNPSIIVAIAGIETYYGKHQGQYNMLNALGTLAFHYPKRAGFFQKELANYFLLNQKMPLSKVKSSYAGAIGVPQFMPSSYLHYSVSNNPKKMANLITNNNDAILSIANYLSKNGWQRNQFVVLPATSKQKPPSQYFFRSAKKTIRWYQQRGIKPEWQLNQNQLASLIKLNTHQEHRYWLALPNFYSILSYNPRVNYAMAVFRLSRALEYQAKHDRKHA
mgnify:CR=1 FL=1